MLQKELRIGPIFRYRFLTDFCNMLLKESMKLAQFK